MTEVGQPTRYAAFTVCGVELEYMIVDRQSLDVRPIADCLLRTDEFSDPDDVEHGDVTWSNELVRHVIELKTTQPTPGLEGWDLRFHAQIREINRLLANHDACLLPTAMHPWMDPDRELQLWPFGSNAIYAAFDRIFDCRGHGWANLQSTHLNLPFAADQEFGNLHAAIRVVLPLLPALAASSPVCNGFVSPRLDERLHVYRTNARRLKTIAGDVIPESVESEADYRAHILQPMYDEIAPWDSEGVLRDEFLNARGAIARFGRGSIEIRLLDIAECPTADVAICQAVTNVVRALAEERWIDQRRLRALPSPPLVDLLTATIEKADRAVVSWLPLLECLGWKNPRLPAAAELWEHLLCEQGLMPSDSRYAQALRHILQHGPVARRIRSRLAGRESRGDLHSVWIELRDCLAENRQLAALT